MLYAQDVSKNGLSAQNLSAQDMTAQDLTTEDVTEAPTQDVPAEVTDISPLLIGEKVPKTKVRSAKGKKVSLYKLLREKPIVLIFYRGGWCPFCNIHLAEMQGIENAVRDLGYQLVAISPDSKEKLSESVKKNALGYNLYSDSKLKLSQAFGIAYQAPKNYKEFLQKDFEGTKR